MSTLSPEAWQELSPYLDQSLEMTQDERVAWLASLREKNPTLCARLESLLHEHQALSDEEFLEKGPDIMSLGPAAIAGQTVGPYKLLSLIGEGGMGSVWLAERNDGRFERRAAVKLLRTHLLGQSGGARFKREGAILARLSHPNIAQLLDAGVSDTGQPYLTLEYVEGEDILRFCDQRKLTVEARIRLFLDVLAAVAHAHSHLIVHRDIKPSNVLVAKDGQVKLLDFGIAKLLADEATPGTATVLTMESGTALTPQFAAPEQITGGTVTTATDVYALGVLLYLLLTGRHPTATKTQSAADLVKAVVDTEPPRASDLLVSAETDGVAEKRTTTVDKLRRQLRGDLDTIVAKTLKKNSAERYNSVLSFADDLQRYLKQEPISARPDTVTYRAAKFIWRNRIGVAAGALTLAAIIIGSAVAIYQARVAQRRFQQVRKLAHTFVFDLHDEVAKLDGSTKVREMMVRTGLEYFDSLAANAGNDLELQAEIAAGYMKIGDAQGRPTTPNLGKLGDALVSYRKAGEIYERIAARDKAYLPDLANYYSSYSGLIRFTNAVQAKQLIQESIQTFDLLRARGPVDPKLEFSYITAWCRLGDIDEDESRYQAAWTEFSHCSDLAHTQLNRNKDELSLSAVSQATERIGTAAQELGYLQESLRAFEEDDAALQQLVAAEPLNPRFQRSQALLYQFRARLYYDDRYPSLDDPARALENARQYLASAQRMVDRDPNNISARTSRAFAAYRTSYSLKEFDPTAAVAMARDAVRRFEDLLAEGKTDRLIVSGRVVAMRLLGEAQLKAGQISEAVHTADEALAARREIGQRSSPQTQDIVELVRSISLCAAASLAAGDSTRAESRFKAALDQAQPLGTNNELVSVVTLAHAEEALGNFYRHQHRITEARNSYQALADIWQRFPAPNEYVDHQKAASKALLASLH